MALPLTTQQIKSRMNNSMEVAVKMAGDALEEVSRDESVKATTKFKMASDYIALFMTVDNHIMKEENHRQSKRLTQLTIQSKQISIDEKNNSDNDITSDFQPVNQSKFKPTMN